MRSALFVASAVLALAGCSSSRMERCAAPESAACDKDSVLDIAKAQATERPERRSDGFGLDRQVLDNEGRPVTDEEVSRLLDWRVAMPKSARLALLES